MAKYIVENSGPLEGTLTISGSKNAVLPLMAASVLTDEKCVICDTPALRDVDVMCALIGSIGGSVQFHEQTNQVELETRNILLEGAPSELAQKMRASVLIMGPLLARTGKAKIALPGGCAIGARPIDLHLKGFQALGAEVIMKQDANFDYVEARAQKLVGSDIYLDFPSVGATENLMMVACMAQGVSTIQNAAEEPEIVDLANFLNKMGARVKGAGTDTIRIEGVPKLKGTKHVVIPDRIETGTFMAAAAITRGRIRLENAVADHVRPVILKLRECGVAVEEDDDFIVVDARGSQLKATNIKTLPYPGFPTDMQSQFMTLLLTAKGKSTIIETVFENRFMHVAQLNKMGARIKYEDRRASIEGPKQLKGAKVSATDLRAGAALVLAGLAASGTTEIDEIYHIERGYERFIEKMRAVGANIRMEG